MLEQGRLQMRAGVFVSIAAAICGSLLVLAAPAGAAPADLDRSFGDGGTLKPQPLVPSNVFEAVRDVATDADGVYFLRSGTRCEPFPCVADYYVTRYDSEGSPDASFGVGGTALALTAPSQNLGRPSLEIDPEG